MAGDEEVGRGHQTVPVVFVLSFALVARSLDKACLQWERMRERLA